MERAALRLAAKSEALAAPLGSAAKPEGLSADSAQDLGRRIWGLATDSEEGSFPAGEETPFSSLSPGRPSQGHAEGSGSGEESLQGVPLPAGDLPAQGTGASQKAGGLKNGVPLIVMEVLGQSLFFSQRDVRSPASLRAEKKGVESSTRFLGSSSSQPLMAQRGARRSQAGFIDARLLLAVPMILSPLILHWVHLPPILGLGLAQLSAFGALVAADRDAYATGWRRRHVERFIPWLVAGTMALAHGFLWVSQPPALGTYLGLGLLPALAFLVMLILMAQDSLTDLPKPWSGLLMLGVLAFALLGLAAVLGTPALLLWKAFLS